MANAQAEELKQKGNKFFQEHKFHAAEDYYSKAIELCPTAILYANRAFANLKLENYGSALQDATKAIELDPAYIKGYYRRGTAYLSLGKYKEGLREFKQVVKIHPTDQDAQNKLKECEKAVRKLAFEEAIATDHSRKSVADTIDLSTFEVEASYKGPHLTGPITLEFVLAMIEEFKNQRKLHKKYVITMLLEIRKILSSLPTLVEIPVDAGEHFTVCGDVHGQFYDLLNIFELNGLPSPQNPYLFNGDFVDRGSFSTEVILTLFAFKMLYPQHMHLTRGNHEGRSMNRMYGFQGEILAKYSETVYEIFAEVFCWLPLAAVIGGKVLVVHGGLFSKDGVTLDDIKKIDRNREIPDEGLMCELLWSDPQPARGRSMSKRGVGVQFGPDVTHRFLAENNLELLVRSHEVKDEGYEVEADGKLITIFSAPNYCDQMGNKGAWIRFESDLKPKFTTFTAVPHPKIAPMAYSGLGSLGM